MIDFASYKTLHLDKQSSKKSGARTDPNIIPVQVLEKDGMPSTPELYLFPNTIPGFSLRRKRWSKYRLIL